MDKKVIGIALICLIIGVGAGYLLSFSQISTLQLQINDLELEITTLTNNYNQLNTTYNNLYTAYAQLEQQVQYEIDVLSDQDYYNTIKNDLQRANETINVAMYSMVYDPDDTFDWANDLIRELVNAKNRGVSVAVIIDDNIVYVGSHNWSESAIYYNHETSVKTVSNSIATIFKDYFTVI